MKKVFYPICIMLGIIALTFSACKKDNTSADDQDISFVEESAQADETFSDLFTDISSLSAQSPGLFDAEAAKVESASKVNLVPNNDCANITVSPMDNTWPKTVTFDFGDGCAKENITRKGKIIAVFTGPFKTAGSKVTITFDGFYVNDTKIEGTKTITNNGKNQAGKYTFSVVVSKSKISNNGGFVTWNSNKTIEWIEGEGTSEVSDDVFSITGTANGTGAKGREFTITITKPLIKKVAWKFIVQGTLEAKSGEFVRTLDYGNGDFDAKAIVTIKGISKEILLKK